MFHSYMFDYQIIILCFVQLNSDKINLKFLSIIYYYAIWLTCCWKWHHNNAWYTRIHKYGLPCIYLFSTQALCYVKKSKSILFGYLGVYYHLLRKSNGGGLEDFTRLKTEIGRGLLSLKTVFEKYESINKLMNMFHLLTLARVHYKLL